MLVLSHHNIYLQLNVDDEANLGMPLSLLGIRAYLTKLSRLRAPICPC